MLKSRSILVSVESPTYQLQLLTNFPSAARSVGMGAHAPHLWLELHQDIPATRQIFFCSRETAARLIELKLMTTNVSGIFQRDSALLWFLRNELVNGALANDRVRVRPEPHRESAFGDVTKSDAPAVEQVFAFTRPIDSAGNSNLPEFHAHAAFGVVHHEGNFSHAHRRARIGTQEDHLIRAATSQSAWALLAQDPSNGFSDVTLAAAIWSCQDRDIPVEEKCRLIGEALESNYFQTAKLH
jgi:hypothetical protein